MPTRVQDLFDNVGQFKTYLARHPDALRALKVNGAAMGPHASRRPVDPVDLDELWRMNVEVVESCGRSVRMRIDQLFEARKRPRTG